MPRPRVCVIGSLNMDLVVRTPRFAQAGETILGGPFATYPGGKGANQAVAAARLGAEVSFVGCVGDDAYGHEFRRVLTAEGIDVTHLTTRSGVSTGVGVIVIDAQGQNSIVVALGANMALTPDDVDRAMPMIAQADVVMLQLEIPLETNRRVIERCQECKAGIMLNAAPAQRVPVDIIRRLGALVMNEIEALAQITPSHGKMPPSALIKTVPHGRRMLKVLTLAERGCVSCTPHSDVVSHPAFSVDTVDTVGAGDCFCAAFAVAIAESAGDAELHSVLRFASAAAAIAVTRHGAIPSMPTRLEVDEFLRQRTTP